MNRWIRTGAPMIGALLLIAAGCSTAVDGVEGAGEGLSLVRKADFSNQLMYINLAVSPAPMTAAEAGDLDAATPVVMRFYDEWAVAWWAPDGEPLVGDPDNAIRMWHVAGNAQQIDGEVRAGEEPTTTEPEEPVSNPNLEMAPVQVESTPSFTLPANQENLLPFAFVDWLEDAYLEWQLIAPGFHPGCA